MLWGAGLSSFPKGHANWTFLQGAGIQKRCSIVRAPNSRKHCSFVPLQKPPSKEERSSTWTETPALVSAVVLSHWLPGEELRSFLSKERLFPCMLDSPFVAAYAVCSWLIRQHGALGLWEGNQQIQVKLESNCRLEPQKST